MKFIILLFFISSVTSIKCRNGGIVHKTVYDREFCECVDHYWGENCEEEDVTRGTKIGCRYVFLNAKNVTHWLLDTNVRKDYKCWVFYGRTMTPKEHQRIGIRIREGRPGIDVAPPEHNMTFTCDNNITDPTQNGTCIINGTVVFDSNLEESSDSVDWELFWWQWEQTHGEDGFKGNAKDPKKKKNFFFFEEHFSMLRRNQVEQEIEHAVIGMKASQAPVEVFFDTDIVTMIYRETDKIKSDAKQYKFSTWTDLDECGSGQHNCHVLYGECTNTMFGFDCNCKKGSVTRPGNAMGTDCVLECHLELSAAPTNDLMRRIRDVEIELDHFIQNLTDTDKALRDGIVSFRDNMVAQKLYTINKMEVFREQEFFTDNQTISNIKEKEDELQGFVDALQGEATNELKRYNENMDKLYYENLKLKAMDDTYTRTIQELKLNSDLKFSRDLASMEQLIEDTTTYMSELSKNMSINQNGLTPSQEAVSEGLVNMESDWRGGIADMTQGISDIDEEIENQFNIVSSTLTNLKNKLGARLFVTTQVNSRRIQWRTGIVNLNGALAQKIVVKDGSVVQFQIAGYYYIVIHALVTPNVRFQWKDIKNGEFLGDQMGVLDPMRSGEDMITGSQILPLSKCDEIQLEVQNGGLNAGTTISIIRINAPFEGHYFGLC